uniref:Uncharacterized protein n=1 Tax=Anguilla anguilla TaxID=7936 RepID=A0A0E9SMH8_ANGAN
METHVCLRDVLRKRFKMFAVCVAVHHKLRVQPPANL